MEEKVSRCDEGGELVVVSPQSVPDADLGAGKVTVRVTLIPEVVVSGSPPAALLSLEQEEAQSQNNVQS